MSIRVLLAVIALLLLLPMLGVGVVQWRTSARRVEAAQDVSAAAARLETMVWLRSGLSAEQLSASWGLVNQGVVGGFPQGSVEMMGLDFGGSLERHQTTVNQRLTELGNPELTRAVAELRTFTDGNDDINALGDGYDDIIQSVLIMTNRELRLLTEAAADADSSDVAVAARVAESAANVEISSDALRSGWVQVAMPEFLRPRTDQVKQSADVLAAFRTNSRKFERVVPSEGPVADEWNAFLQSDVRRTSLAHYDQAILDHLRDGVPEQEPDDTELDVTGADLQAMLALASEMSDGLNDWRIITAQLGQVVDAALTEVRQAADRSLADAQQDRNVTSGWILVAGFVGVGATLALIMLVSRPLQRLADTAHELSQGRLSTRLEEKGPTEIRVSARALNEAMASLETAEAQAIALAEERLDDKVISSAAPGQLGASLQAAVARLARNLSEREEFQQRLAHEASHDGLTKLPNRNAVLRHLESAIARTRRGATSLALLFIDLDEFKSINDRHGHQAGDKVLQETARRLVESVRAGDLAGRFGGDEFLVVAEPIDGIHEATALAERIQETITQPIVIDGATVIPKISIGISLADGSLTAEELLRDADLAVYRAKSAGKDAIEICDEDLRGEVRSRDEMELAIRQALDEDQFELHYQAAVHAPTKAVSSFEALLRWDRPGHGRVPPNEFIPVAERTDLIVDIDRWVLNAAVAQLDRWTDHPELGYASVALNISSRHLGSGELYNDVRVALDRYGVDPRRLTLEVTETAILEDMIAAGRELSALRDFGVPIALDDFGTGYMSLAHLRGLPVDSLKIDGSFVAAMDNDADYTLIQLIVKTGHLLNVTITAEGVETDDQADRLKDIGCDYLQGFRFSRPCSAADTEAWILDRAESTPLIL